MAWFDGVEEPRLLIAPVPCTSNLSDSTVDSEGSIITLCHPKTGMPTSYIFVDGVLQELNWFKQPFGSWFLGDYVCEDGSLYIATVVDPIFILLPIFEDARMKKGNDQGMFRQLDEILYVDCYPGYQHLTAIARNSMQLVCEVKEIGSTMFFRLDDSKVLAWLCCKVHQLRETLKNMDKYYVHQAETNTLKDIISILGEYLKDEPWLTLICNHFHLNIEEIHKRTPSDATGTTFVESIPVPTQFQEKIENGKQQQRSSSRISSKQSKKLKTEEHSKNIKDMFRRASQR